uniref:Isomerase BH0283 n=1 Tax=Aegilops tauschii subsp. strangulata TaxID=200361 RepID=A0A453EP95_AEGTS
MVKKGIQYVVVSALFSLIFSLVGSNENWCSPVVWSQVDAFTAQPFKGNPAAVCFLEDDAAAPAGDGRWMQSVAVEFNLSQTAFFSRDSSCAADATTPRFHLRWFTPVTEVALCGHATLATAHFLFTSVLAERHGVVEFATKSGVLTAKKVPAPEAEEQGKLFIELDFPMSDYVGCDPADELPSIPETLNGAPVVSVHKSVATNDFIVELSSGKEVADVLPNIEEIRKCAGRGVIVTAPAPAGSG